MMEFLDYLRNVKKRSERSLRTYHSILREFRRFEPITPRSWGRYLEHIKNNTPRTQRLKLTVVKKYLNWKADNNLITVDRRFWNEAEAPREKKLPTVLTVDEIKKLLNSIDNEYYKAIFTFLFTTGMRISEFVNLKVEDITLMGNTAQIRIYGKGRKERVITVKRGLIDYAMKQGIFTKKVSARAIEKALQKYSRKAGINKRITPHTLRHSFAVALIEKGLPLNKIQALLGHSNIATTSVYLEVSSSNVLVPSLL